MTTTFEDRLGAELRAVVAANPAPVLTTSPARRPVRRGLVAGGAGAAALTAAVLITQAGGSPAFAVGRAGDGTVTVTIKRTDDAGGLQDALRAAGVDAYVDYLPVGKTCAPGRFTLASGPVQTRGSVRLEGDAMTFSITSAQLSAGAALVVEATADGDLSSLAFAFAAGAVQPCTPVDGSIEPGAGGPAPRTGPEGGPTLARHEKDGPGAGTSTQDELPSLAG